MFMVHLPACRVTMEACGGAHHWARTFRRYGHLEAKRAGIDPCSGIETVIGWDDFERSVKREGQDQISHRT